MVVREKHIDVDEVEEPYWMRREDFLVLNPASEVPVLVDEDGQVVAGGMVIAEYLEEVYPEVPLIGSSPKAKAETRRLVAWFEVKFKKEVTKFLAGEKLTKRVLHGDTPDSRALRAGRENIHAHLDYIAWLTSRRSWLAGDSLTLADLIAGAHISLVDYSGDVPWEDHPLAKEWYVRLKSRPSVRPLLSDYLPGIAPALVYADLDF